MKIEETYPMLGCLFGTYFKDWDDNYDSLEAAISVFVQDGDKQRIKDTIVELKMLLKENHKEEEWFHILYNFGCSYALLSKRINLTEWLKKVQRRLEYELIEATYPMLGCLLGAYFNQDWEDDYDSPEAVISAFAQDGNKQGIKDAIVELKMLLKEKHTKEEWLHILDYNFGCSYPFWSEDIHPVEWFKKVQKQLEDELILAEKKGS